MATLPLRPPQFSDDVAWLPAWLQPNQSPPLASQDVSNSHLFQNLNSCKGEKSQVKEPNLTSRESKYNIGPLYLSGDNGSPATLTSSCEKVLHFNLHLSIDGTSSITSNPLLRDSQVDKLNSTLILDGTRDKSKCFKGHNPSKLDFVPSTSSDDCPQHFASLTPISNHAGQNTIEILNSKCADYDNNNASRLTPINNDAGQNTLEILNSKCADYGDISDSPYPTAISNGAGQNTLEILNSKCAETADYDDISNEVELSVAASEALVIHKVIQSGLVSETLSNSAILEVALRVKQARLDESKESPCYFKDSGNTVDNFSDLGDSDMEDAYKDVGLYVCSLDNTPLEDLSASRVKETPMSEIPGEDKEVQCRWQGHREMYSDDCYSMEPQERNVKTNKPKDLPAEIFNNEKAEKLCRNLPVDLVFLNQPENENSDELQTLQNKNDDMSYEGGFPLQLEIKSRTQPQHTVKEKEHHVVTSVVNDSTSYGFESRWFGGWTGMVGYACGETKSQGRNAIPNYFIGETSYLSESMDIFPDQNSIVHDHQLCSNASVTRKHMEEFYKTASEGAFASQEPVKDSTACIDPLCSRVPCSISSENGDSFLLVNQDEDHQELVVLKGLPSCTEAEIAQTSSAHRNENVGREQHNEHNVGYPSIHRQLTTLKTYSTGLAGDSVLPSKWNFDCGFVNMRENNARMLSGSTKSPNGKETKKKAIVRSMFNSTTSKSNHADVNMKELSVEQHLYCTDTTEKGNSRKEAQFLSSFSCATATNNTDSHVKNSCGRLIQDFLEGDAEKGVELQVHPEDIPTSPLVLCRRSRRFKAPKLHVNNVSTSPILEDQALDLNEIVHEKIPQDHSRNLCRGDVPSRKRVHFADVDSKVHIPQGQQNEKLRSIRSSRNRSSCRLGDRPVNFDQEQGTASQEVKERLTKCRIKGRKRTIFQGLDFLLTGFSKRKEKDIEGLLRKHGGTVLSDIPVPHPHPRKRRSLRFNAQRLPVVLSTKKLQTTRFLYGCAVNAFLLDVGWAYDSIRAGSVLLPDKYLILSNTSNRMLNQLGKFICQNDNDYIFDKIGVMLHGTHKFCTKLAKVIKHGRGHVHKSLQWLVQSLENKKISLGVIVVEDENRAARHLKKCAAEQKIAVVPEKWIINSLIEGKLLPLPEYCHSSNPQAADVPEISVFQDWSEEI